MSALRADQARKATLGLLAALLVLMTVETILFAPPGIQVMAIAVVIAIKIIPPGLFYWPVAKGRAFSAVWLGILLLPYFCWAVLGGMVAGLEGGVAVIKAILTASCFVSAMYFAKWQRAATGQ
ncbi:MAG: DUF2069 domain-containing protein [Moraxellaceae bacterium]|jgi:uncharacterized membrane protein|nr:DUF2069 domain-containing protein [Moraxellaceae bacterium]